MTFTEKRLEDRTYHQANLTYCLLEDNQYREAKTINHSPGGLLLESDTACRTGDRLHLCMDEYLPKSSGPEAYRSYTAEVMSCRLLSNEKDPRYGIGITFLDKMQTDFFNLKEASDSIRPSGELRHKAEQFLIDHPKNESTAPNADGQKLAHEQQVHQIELEIENDKLRRVQRVTSAAMLKYADLYNFAPVGFFTFDPFGQILEINLTGAKLLQLELKRLKGVPFTNFIIHEDKALFRHHCTAVMASQAIQKVEIRLQPKGKDLIQARIESKRSRVSSNEDIPNRIFSVVIDITKRKLAEEVHQIMEKRLARAEKLEAIGTLSGGVAHNFNNALMGIQGSISLIRFDLDPNHPHMVHLDRIEDMVERSTNLTRQLLGFAREGKYQARPIDLNTVIENTLELFTSTHRDLKTTAKLQDDYGAVAADRSQLEQVFFNLFLNAHHAMPQGGHLSIKTSAVEKKASSTRPFDRAPGSYVKITITDTGVGMDAQTCRKIFDPFFTTQELGQSTGMGLASVYGIIDNHNGFIEVQSQLGKGTRFDIYLPMIDAEVQTPEKKERKLRHGTETVMLVDDEPQIRQVASRMLEYLGYKVKLANSGEDAIRLYDPARIDLVLLDMTMPDMNGGQTFDQLRILNSAIKVVLASGYSLKGRAEEIVKRGCIGFIQKPYSMSKLSDILRTIFDDS